MEGEGASFELHEKFYLQNKGTHVVVQMQKSRSIYIQDRIERVPTPEIWSKMISEREFFLPERNYLFISAIYKGGQKYIHEYIIWRRVLRIETHHSIAIDVHMCYFHTYRKNTPAAVLDRSRRISPKLPLTCWPLPACQVVCSDKC